MPVNIASSRHVTVMKLAPFIALFPCLVLAQSNLTGSPLWDNILIRCSSGPTFSCVQNEFRSYIEVKLKGDLNITDSIVFVKNDNSYSWKSKPKIIKDQHFSNFIDTVEESENEVYPQEKTDMFKSKAPRLNILGLADLFYNKGIGYLMNHDLHLSLPSFIGGGTLSISPKSLDDDGALVKLKYKEPEEQDESFKPTGRIFLVKRIKKFINKKLLTSFLAALLIIALLKIKLLFFFPLILGVGAAKKLLLKALLFIFPALSHLFKLCAYYHHQHTKYHHHHHQVAHHHHHVPVPVVSPSYHDVPEYLDHPPPGWHRMGDPPNNVELESWGIEHDESYQPTYSTRRTYPAPTRYQDSLNVSPNINNNIKVYEGTTKAKGVLSLGGFHDAFYSPILVKLDEVFNQLGFLDEGCKERLICSMYKAPDRFSPHSNLVSAQLSRDASELLKPGYTNPAVQRFYKYVQAARDGQDLKNCLVLYPSCSVITE